MKLSLFSFTAGCVRAAGREAAFLLNADVSDDVLKKAVEDQDYPVTGIQ